MNAIELPRSLLSDLRSIGLNPKDIVLYINSACNLRCKHCYVGTSLLDSAFYYSVDSINNFVNDLPALDRITILGGEPLFHPNLSEIVKTIGQISCSERRITTNLTIFHDEALASLRKAKFRVCVSLDGHTSILHDQLRGEGAFAKTLANLQKIIEAGFDVEVTHTVTMQNIDHFDDFVSLCRSIGLTNLNLHRVSLRGNALSNRHLDVTATTWRKLIDAIENKAKSESGNLRVRYEVGFASKSEYEELVSSGKYKHHSQSSFYSPTGGSRVVIFPNKHVYISSEAFGTNSFVGDFSSGQFKLNMSPENELQASARVGFNTAVINREIRGDENYPVPLSVSYRRSAHV